MSIWGFNTFGHLPCFCYSLRKNQKQGEVFLKGSEMKALLLYILIIIPSVFSAQELQKDEKAKGYFKKSRAKLLSLDSLEYHLTYFQKTLFNNDTTVKSARVILKKRGADLGFFRIMEDSLRYELLYSGDTLWSVDHQLKSVFFMGKGLENIQGTALSSFLLDFLFQLSNPSIRDAPGWELKEMREKLLTIMMKLTPTEDFTEVSVSLQLDTVDLLVYKELLVAIFRNQETQYQEKRVDQYSFPEEHSLAIPGSFSGYSKVFPRSEAKKDIESTGHQDRFIRDMNLMTISGEPYSLPGQGLIFFDFWYVGCLPCLKSAPVIEKLYREFGDRICFFGINEVDKERSAVQAFLRKMAIGFPVLMSKHRFVEEATLSRGYPGFVLLEAESGKILWYHSGFSDDLEQQIRRAFKTFLLR